MHAFVGSCKREIVKEFPVVLNSQGRVSFYFKFRAIVCMYLCDVMSWGWSCCCVVGSSEPVGVFHQDDSSDLTHGKMLSNSDPNLTSP